MLLWLWLWLYSHGLLFLFWPFRVWRWIMMRLGIETCGFYLACFNEGTGRDDAGLLWKHMGVFAFALIGIGYLVLGDFFCSWLF